MKFKEETLQLAEPVLFNYSIFILKVKLQMKLYFFLNNNFKFLKTLSKI